MRGMGSVFDLLGYFCHYRENIFTLTELILIRFLNTSLGADFACVMYKQYYK
jgi:hypothetical protein